jgi:hypothetical protein
LGRERGIDILATQDGERWVIEAKGQAARGLQQVNYFLGALGELVQRMDRDEARYGLALPSDQAPSCWILLRPGESGSDDAHRRR